MARSVSITCDVCRKPTKKIVGKLHYIPMIPGVSRGVHSNYTHHLDVGVCCKDRIFRLFSFTPRITAKEYNESRKNRERV